MKKYFTLALLPLTVCACLVTGCQSIGTVVVEAPDEVTVEQQRINVYHNVHYHNRGFYPKPNYQAGGYYWMRGYRY